MRRLRSAARPSSKRGFRSGLLWAVLWGLASPAFAQSIQVTIDRTEATVQDQLNLRVTVKGSQNAEPEMPDLSAFNVYYRGEQSQINMINRQTTVSMIYNYVLVPKQVGEFTIGAAKVQIDGRSYTSRPFKVRILAASAKPRESEGLFIRQTVSNKNPYVGEQVIYTWR
ncbi:MAG: BatD family protein, partial [Acidobacteriota bacterium]